MSLFRECSREMVKGWLWSVGRWAGSALLVAAALPGATASADLFITAVSRDSSDVSLSQSPTVLRQRAVTVNLASLDSAAPQRGGSLRLNLFDDAKLDAVFDSGVSRAADRFTWFGHLLDDPESALVLTRERGIVVAELQSPTQGFFRVRHRSDGTSVVQEIDPSQIPSEASPLHSDLSTLPLPQVFPSPQDGGEEIDVMVVYTPAARESEGGEASILAEIQQAMDVTNDAYERSEVSQRLRLVHAEEVEYTESDDMEEDLKRLRRTTDGHLDEVHALRSAHGADLVCLWTGAGSYAGIAYQMDTLSTGFAVYGFSVVRSMYAVGNLTFAHELGHNMGCAHDHDQDSEGLFSHSHGHRWTTEGEHTHRSIMAYSPGWRVRQFSNPDVLESGGVTGVPVGEIGEAHNALTLNTSASTVADFRPSADGFVGDIWFDAETYRPRDQVVISLHDLDLTADSSVGVILITETGDSESVTLLEHTTGSPSFSASVATTAADPVSGDGQIQVAIGEIITVGYADENSGNGVPAQIEDTAVIVSPLSHFTWHGGETSIDIGRPMEVSIAARDADSVLDSTFTGSVDLSAMQSGSPSPHTVFPVEVGPFSAGLWVGEVQILGEGGEISLLATAPMGQTGESPSLTLVDSPIALILCHLLHGPVLTPDQVTRADVDGSGGIDITDLVRAVNAESP
jgi:Metallo-peptidase family M12